MSDSMPSHALRKVLNCLKHFKRSSKGYKACCPAHEDHKPSLSVWERVDGSIGLKCYAGCDRDAICAALRLDPSDLQPERPNSSARSSGDWRHNPKTKAFGEDTSPRTSTPTEKRLGFPTLDSVVQRISESQGLGQTSWNPWIYYDADGNQLGAVVRWDQPDGKKEIRPFRFDGNQWHVGAMPAPRPLYQTDSTR